MCTFNRNNRECIHKLKSDKKFIDFTEEQDYYLCNDELNIAGIEEDDLVKFRVLVDGTYCDTERVYGFVKYIKNTNHTTFMICQHYDENGDEFMLDYVYSSFYHAFKRLNHIGSFYNWVQLTNIFTAHQPKWFADYWMKQNNKTNNKFEDDVIEEDDELEPLDEIDQEDINQYEQRYYGQRVRDTNKDILEQINNLNKSIIDLNEKINHNSDVIANVFNKLNGQVSELSNRINIISKSVINTDSLNKIINQEQNKPAYSKPKYINHTIC